MGVRRAEVSDLAELLELEAGCFTGDRISPRAMRAWIKRPSGDLIVVECDGRVAGYGLTIYRRDRRYGRIFSLAVSSEFRGRGLGKTLLTACEAYAIKRGYQEIHLEVSVRNRPAISLYENLGYVVFATEAGFYEDGSDALKMSKRLSS